MTKAVVEPAEHPAVKAWTKLRAAPSPPAPGVETLQRRNKGTVYRLISAGPSSSDVVAKRASRERITRESLVYEHVLPALSVTAVRYYGRLEGTRDGSWLFVSYAGRENYSSLAGSDRSLAARWLAALHTSSASAPSSRPLPDRGPAYYLHQLETGRDEILEHLPNPALERSDTELLLAIVRQVEVLASRWRDVQRICDLTPRAFVHGDFAPKNIRIPRGGGAQLIAFDWASGGRGVPAVDLPQLDTNPSTYWANPDLDTYLAAVAPSWPQLRRSDLSQIAAVGKMLRTIVCIRLEAVCVATDWPQACMWNMRYYRADMADALRVLGWDP